MSSIANGLEKHASGPIDTASSIKTENDDIPKGLVEHTVRQFFGMDIMSEVSKVKRPAELVTRLRHHADLLLCSSSLR